MSYKTVNFLFLHKYIKYNSNGFFYKHLHIVAKHFWCICLLGRAIAGLSYRWFIANHYTFKLPMYIQNRW